MRTREPWGWAVVLAPGFSEAVHRGEGAEAAARAEAESVPGATVFPLYAPDPESVVVNAVALDRVLQTLSKLKDGLRELQLQIRTEQP